MTIVTATDFRKNMSFYVKKTREDKTPITITTQKQGAMVLLPLEDWEALNETLYLTSTPANKKKLDDSIQNIRSGKYTSHNLIEA